jgi:serine/threonine protein kinase
MTEPPALVGRYHVVRLIAHGGMGSLYLARDPAIDRLVAIKLLRDGIDDTATRERFTREARAAGRLHHPNIVTVFDVGEHDGRPFIAMEYVRGETLAQLISRRALVRLTEKLAILEVLCAALHHAHSAAIVHRDIKPANVMLDAAGVLKVLDFGIARAGGLVATRVGDVVGTLNYMSPEQLAGEEVDHRTDIYSVGTVAYELLTNQMSFPGTVTTGVLHKILNATPPPIDSLLPGIDADIVTIIEHAMEKDPDARYQDLEAMRADLAEVRTRLIETGSDVDEAADADAETRLYSAIGSTSLPKSSRRPGSLLPSSGRLATAQSAVRARPRKRFRKVAFIAIGLAVLAIALTARWIVTQRGSVSSPAITETTTAQEPPQQSPATSAVDPRQPDDTGRVAVDQQLLALRTRARQQIVAGERQAALDTLTRGLTLDAKDPELNALLDDLVGVARRVAVEARTAAARRGAKASGFFREAQAREREADSLLRAGDRVPAAQAYWVATSRYNQAPEEGRQTAAVTPPSDKPLIAAPSATRTPIELPALSTKSPPAPPTLNSSPTTAEQTAPPLPVSPKPVSPPSQRDVTPDPGIAQRDAIRLTLRRYSEAYQSLDSNAVGAVMPALTADQLRSLERDLSNFRSYKVDIRDERISVDGGTATVTCQVIRSFETKSGVAGSNTVETVFHLRQIGTSWTIDRVESR